MRVCGRYFLLPATNSTTVCVSRFSPSMNGWAKHPGCALSQRPNRVHFASRTYLNHLRRHLRIAASHLTDLLTGEHVCTVPLGLEEKYFRLLGESAVDSPGRVVHAKAASKTLVKRQLGLDENPRRDAPLCQRRFLAYKHPELWLQAMHEWRNEAIVQIVIKILPAKERDADPAIRRELHRLAKEHPLQFAVLEADDPMPNWECLPLSSDVTLFSSGPEEAFGLLPLEAMLSGSARLCPLGWEPLQTCTRPSSPTTNPLFDWASPHPEQQFLAEIKNAVRYHQTAPDNFLQLVLARSKELRTLRWDARLARRYSKVVFPCQ